MRCAPLLLAAAMVAAFVSPAPAADEAAAARAWLAESMKDRATADTVLMILASTEDASLVPVFAALAEDENKERRLYAVTILEKLGGERAVAALGKRLGADPSMGIRAEALLALAALGRLTDEQLLAALETPDEAVQSIAARHLVRRERSRAARPVLDRLADSSDKTISAMARLTLLKAGDASQITPLEKVVAAKDTSDETLAILMEQIAEDDTQTAAGLAEQVSESARPHGIRLVAWQARAKMHTPDAVFVKAIQQGEGAFRIALLRILADTNSPFEGLRALSADQQEISVLAKVELARLNDPNALSEALLEAVKLEHPIIIDYLLDRAGADMPAGEPQAGRYVGPLLRYIESTSARARQMQPEHIRAARATTLLADCGTPEAMDGLKALLAEPYSPRVRAVGAGLLRTRNRAACDLARPLLTSPYDELVTDAILVLGKFGDPEARPHLAAAVADPARHGLPMTTMCAWYLVRSGGLADAAVDDMANRLNARQ